MKALANTMVLTNHNLSDDVFPIFSLSNELLVKIIFFSADQSHFLKDVICLERVNKRFLHLARSREFWKDVCNLEVVIDSKSRPWSINGQTYHINQFPKAFGAFLKRVVSIKLLKVTATRRHKGIRCIEAARRCADCIWVKRNIIWRWFLPYEQCDMRSKFELSKVVLDMPNHIMARFVPALYSLNLSSVRTLEIGGSLFNNLSNVIWRLIGNCGSVEQLKIGLRNRSQGADVNMSKLNGCINERLHSLTLTDSGKITDWKTIFTCYPNLRSLEMSGSSDKLCGLMALWRFFNLSSLDVKHRNHLEYLSLIYRSDGGLEWFISTPSLIKLFPHLNSLSIRLCQLISSLDAEKVIESILKAIEKRKGRVLFTLKTNFEDKKEVINRIRHDFHRITDDKDGIRMTKGDVTIIIDDYH